MRRRFLILIAVCTLTLSGCITATEIRKFDDRAPAPVANETRSIMFKRLVSKLSRGQEIGTVQAGLACVGQSKLFWKRGGQFQVGDEELADTLKEELTRAGYNVVGDPNSLFEDPQEWKAEFLIAGVIRHVAVNLCYPWGGFRNFVTSSGEASVEVEWQVFERRARSVVLTTTTGGTAKTDSGAHQGVQAYYNAFSAAIRNLLAEERFASLMSRSLAKSTLGPPQRSIEILTLEGGETQSQDLIQLAHGAVVTIPVGTGHGSGVIIGPGGLVLTNAHVVGVGSGMVTVELATGRGVVGDVVGVNSEVDVALIQLEKGRYLSPPIGSSEGLIVGMPVFAIGSPLDQRLSRTLTKGVVSAFREQDGRKLIQSDVTVHPGNSGGPLLDERGRVVGIAQSGIMLGGRVGIGLNLFVPIEEAWKALNVNAIPKKTGVGELLGGISAPSGGATTVEPTGRQADVTERLRLIQDLREKGLISNEEAEQRRRDILDRAFR